MNRLSLFFLALTALAMTPALSSPFGCGGCDGDSTANGYANAGLPCLGTPGTVPGEWVIEVMVDVSDGYCQPQISELTQSCSPRGCQNEVAYTWGSQMSAGGIDMGYVNNADPNVTRTYFYFIDDDPVVPGEYGTVVFPAGSAQTTSCGSSVQFFMEAHMCGDQLATATSYCSSCSSAL